MSTWQGLTRGLAAGAVGTTVLNAVTQLDVVLRARPASEAPQQVAEALVDRGGVRVPGGRRARGRRLAGLGPLGGTAVGLAVGALGGVLRAAGLTVPVSVGGPLLGVSAMLATDGPIAALGVDDPRGWSRADWAADVVPHLAYGLAAHSALTAAIPDRAAAARRPSRDVLVRAAALGAATGARSSAGITALAVASPGRRGALLATLAVSEVVLDKLPVTPARTAPQGLVPRAALGASSAAAVARREGHEATLAGAVGLAAALGVTAVGPLLRSAASRRLGSDLPGALVEDVLAALLARRGARPAAS